MEQITINNMTMEPPSHRVTMSLNDNTNRCIVRKGRYVKDKNMTK